jgi:hypothetical protein
MNNEDMERVNETLTVSETLINEEPEESDVQNDTDLDAEQERDPDEEDVDLDLDHLEDHPSDTDDDNEENEENAVNHEREVQGLIETIVVEEFPNLGPRMSEHDFEHIGRLHTSIVEGFNNLGVYHCPTCDESLTRVEVVGDREIRVNIEENDVYDHVMAHFSAGDLNNFICTICSARFESEYIYNLHIANHIDNGEYLEQEVDSDEDDEEDDIFAGDEDDIDDEDRWDSLSDSNSDTDNPYDVIGGHEGDHVCPFCQRHYETEVLLGEHFIRRHGTYDQLSGLASRRRVVFPGYECLIDVGMITYMDKTAYEETISNDSTSTNCTICCIDYVEPEDEIRPDSEADRSVCRPLKLNCCSQMICTSCIANHLRRMGILSCPYCRHDHTPEVNEDAPPSESEDENPREVTRRELQQAINEAIHDVDYDIESTVHQIMELEYGGYHIIDDPNGVALLSRLMNPADRTDRRDASSSMRNEGTWTSNLSFVVQPNIEIDFGDQHDSESSDSSDASDDSSSDGGYAPPTLEELSRGGYNGYNRIQHFQEALERWRQSQENGDIVIEDALLNRIMDQFRNIDRTSTSDGPSESSTEPADNQTSRDLYTRRVQLLDAWNRINLDEVSDVGSSDTDSNVSGTSGVDSEAPVELTVASAAIPTVTPLGSVVSNSTQLAEATSCPSYIINPGASNQIHVPDVRLNRNRHNQGVNDYNRLMNNFDAALDEEDRIN